MDSHTSPQPDQLTQAQDSIRDAPEKPGQAPKTKAAHLALHLPGRPRVPQASVEVDLFPRGPLGNVVPTRIRLVKMAPVSRVSPLSHALGYADSSAVSL